VEGEMSDWDGDWDDTDRKIEDDERRLSRGWKPINEYLQGDKPNRWITLREAVKLIVETLKVPPGEAQELLQTQTLPPAVPWVGDHHRYYPTTGGSRHFMEIRRSSLISADANFDPHLNAIWFDRQGRIAGDAGIERVHIERNHLEAWLEKYKARTGQPVPASPEDRPEKGEMFSQKKEHELLQKSWEDINHHLQGDKPNRWITLSRAARLIAEELNVQVGEAEELLLKEAKPPAVPWVGVLYVPPSPRGLMFYAEVRCISLAEIQAYVKHMQREDGTIPLVAPLDIKALEDAFVDVTGGSVVWPGGRHYMEDIQIEQNHLEAWLEKYKARVAPPASREADSETEAPDPYYNGFPGRPSIKHLILAELKRRAEAGETLPAVGKEAQALHEWAAEHHPRARTPGIGAIENFIRDSHRKLRPMK
jgi:hypothetical protein